MSRPPAAEPPNVVVREANGARLFSRRRRRAAALVAGVCALAAPAARAETRRYGDLRFDDAGWLVEKESTASLVLRPDNEIVGDQVRLTLWPARPAPEGLDAALEAAWTEALAGRTPSEEPNTSDELEVPEGGRARVKSAATSPAGGVLVTVVAVGDFASRLTVTASTDLAWGAATALFTPLLFSLEVVPKEPPRISGTGGGGGGGSLPGFDWDGPDRVEWGIVDPHCRFVDSEFGALVRSAGSLVGSVAPRALDWAQALASARRLLADPAAKASFDAAHQLAGKGDLDLYTTGAAARLQQGDGAGALAHLLAGAEKAPSDPNRLFDFASGLALAGLANESLATLGRLRGLGKPPSLALGIDAEAATAYVEGYDEMLRGRLAQAKARLGVAISREPFLYEARHALALVQAHEGNAAAGKATYRQGLYRFQPKQLLFCGGDGDQDEVRAPVDEMFDTSMGVDGKLVPFWHPQKADMLPKWLEAMGAIAEERKAAFDSYSQRSLSLSETLHAPEGPDAYEAWADRVSDLIDSLEETEPIVMALQKRVEAASENLGAVAGQAGVDFNRKVMRLAISGKPNICREIKAASSAGINAISPAVHQVELAHRENARVWYKIATGLASNLGGKWQDYHDANLRGTLEAWNLGLLAEMVGAYGLFSSDQIPDCADDEQAPSATPYEAPPGTPCEQVFRNLKIKHSFDVPGRAMGPKIGYEIGCDKIKAEIEYDVVGGKWEGFGTGLGGFASVEVGKRGDFSVFAGARGDVSVPGAKGSVKSGLYLEGNEAGDVTGFGGRVEMSGQAGGSATVKAKEDMKFNLLPTPAAAPARGPALRTFRPPN